MNQDNEQDLIAQFKQRIGGQKTNVNTNTKYQYPYVELETVMANPSEYIIPACLPACRELWDKNIETFMVSNFEDNHLYVLLTNVSNENKAIFSQLQKQDPRFIFDGYRTAIGIAVNGTDESDSLDLLCTNTLDCIVDTGEVIDITPVINLTNVIAPIAKGEVVGTITYTIDEIEYSSDLIASHDVYSSDAKSLIILLSIIFIILLVVVLFLSIPKKHKNSGS